jgi:hypothetical protein
MCFAIDQRAKAFRVRPFTRGWCDLLSEKEQAMRTLRNSIAYALGAALITGQMAGVAAAAPLPTNIGAMKSVAADAPTQVYWRGGWGWGWGVGALAAGAIIGGAIATAPYGYYGAPGYYGYPYRSYGYYPRAAYYAPYYGYPYGYYARPYRVYRPYYGYPYY